MDIFGTAHRDEHDSAVAFSVMIPLSDLPDTDGWEPGRFHFITRGFYVSLAKYNIIYFSGRLPHGGTAPLAPGCDQPPSWAIRFVLIGYPPRALVEGSARHTFAALPQGELFLTPEMTGMKCVCSFVSTLCKLHGLMLTMFGNLRSELDW